MLYAGQAGPWIRPYVDVCRPERWNPKDVLG